MLSPNHMPHYTVADYWTWSGEWELWDGVAIAMTPSPFGRHQQIVSRMLRIFGRAISESGCDCEPISELDWVVAEDTVVRPDLMLLCGGVPEKYLETAPALVVEVTSESTAAHDRGFKRALYEAQCVRHYLIVNSVTRQIEHCVLEQGAYVLQHAPDGIYHLDFTPTCRLACDFRGL
jgi:Uma2 family endonuclease